MAECMRCGRSTRSQDGVCKTCLHGPPIPGEVVAPLVKRMVEDRHYTYHQGKLAGGFTVLSEETGVESGCLHRVMHEPPANLTWNTVDRLLTKTGNWLLWYEEPLREFYDEKAKIVRGESRTAVCKCGRRVKVRGMTNGECRLCTEENPLPKCGCGKRLSKKTHKSCRACLNKKGAAKNARRWVNGESWQVPLTGTRRV